jgi:arylsulfatase A-like enzyme
LLPEGVDYGRPICGLDIYPTTAGLCGLAPPAGLHGLDYAAALAADPQPTLRDAVLVQWEQPRFAFGDHPYRALRGPTYTYVVGRDDAFCLLFDHETDPWELDNRFWAPEDAGTRASLHALLVELIEEAGEPVPEYVARRAP